MRLTFIVVMLVLILASVIILPCGEKTTSLSAWKSLQQREAWRYHEVILQRIEILHDGSVTDAYLPAYRDRPYVLFSDDIAEDANDWRNRSMAQFYDKNSVTREAE